MFWMGLIAAGQAVAGGLQQSTQKHLQQAQAYQQESDLLVQNTADNQAISAANFTNMIRNGYRQGLLNVQRAQAAREARSQGIGLQRSVQRVFGAATANAAAAGAVGASVDAVAQDIAVKADQADAQYAENARVTVENFDEQLNALIMAGQDAVISSKKVQTRRTPNYGNTSYAEIALNGLLAGVQASGLGSSPVNTSAPNAGSTALSGWSPILGMQGVGTA